MRRDRRRAAQLRAATLSQPSAMRPRERGPNLQRFLDGLIFRPRRAFGRELFDLRVASAARAARP